jgi:inner membrane protein involved in colicin E2 resistance
MAMKKNNQITIRLDPLTDPKNKIDAVKISLVNIAKQYKKIDLNRRFIYYYLLTNILFIHLRLFLIIIYFETK